MGTAAMVGIYDSKTETVVASYCHYDGYVEGVGRTLVENYNSQYDAEIVAQGGYMSSLDADYLVTRQEAVHSEEAMIYHSVETFSTRGAQYSGADYLYLWDGQAWFFMPTNGEAGFEEVQINLKKVA